MAAQLHCVGFLLLSIRMCLKKTWLDFLAHVGRHRDEFVKSTVCEVFRWDEEGGGTRS